MNLVIVMMIRKFRFLSSVAAVLFLLVFLVHCGSSGGQASHPDISEPPVTVSFVTFGDWGSGESAQEDVAQAIGAYCASDPCEFLLTLGDNFYDEGVSGVDDSLWQTVYHDVYDFLGLPFYVALGDHDTEGDIQAQVDYSSVDPDWHLPSPYYSFKLPLGSSNPFAEIFVTYSDDFGDAQQSWLKKALLESRATWKLLVVHDPIYSNGYHGDDDAGINEELLPIICNKVDLVLSGDDHNFAHLRSSQDGCPVEQLVIGTGGAGLRPVDTTDPRTVFSASVHGFGWMQISQRQILLRMITTAGETLYQTSWTK